MAVSKRLRFEILRRDNHACRYCGCRAPDAVLTIDHVVPVSLGGSDQPDNLVAACRDCNAGKSSASQDAAMVADVAQDALRWAAAMRAALRVQADRLHDLELYVGMVDVLWTVWEAGGEPLPRPPDWRTSVERFHAYPVTRAEWEYAIRKAMTKPQLRGSDLWRYTCGVLWRQLSERVELAQESFSASVIEGDF